MDEFTGRIRPYLRVKALTIFLVILLTTLKIMYNVVEPAAYLVGVVAALLSAVTGLGLWLAAARRKIAPVWVHASLILDLTAVMIGLYFYGGPQTTWGFIPIVVIVMASFLFDIRTTVFYGLLTGALLLGVYALDYLNILPHQPAFHYTYSYWRNGDYLFDLLSGLFLLFTLVTSASAYFQQTVRDSVKHLVEAQTEARDATADLTATRAELEQRARESDELFNNSPVSLWEEDYSELNAYFDMLRRDGINDFAAYFAGHPDEVAKCAGLIRIIKVNRATLDLYGAASQSELTQGVAKVFGPESYEVFKQELIALAQGKTYFASKAVNRRLSGEQMIIDLKMTVLPDRRRVLISIVDLTEQKKIEEDLQQKMKELKAFSDAAIGRELKMAEMEKELARLKELMNR